MVAVWLAKQQERLGRLPGKQVHHKEFEVKTVVRFGTLVIAVLAVVLVGGCSTPLIGSSATYSYEPRFSFAELKTYRWTEAKPQYSGDPLLESNVRFLADRALQSKGFTSKADKADFNVSMRYDGSYLSEIRTLALHVFRADNNELIWRGVATGSIKTDAASDDLKNAVEGMLAHFPPK
jgi:hypothetical protein